jgi:hypothetical protein
MDQPTHPLPENRGVRAAIGELLAIQRREVEEIARELEMSGGARPLLFPPLIPCLRAYCRGRRRRGGFPGLVKAVVAGITGFSARARAREIYITNAVKNTLDAGPTQGQGNGKTPQGGVTP